MTECRERAHEVVCDVPISAKPSIAPTNSPSHARLSFVVIGCFLVGDADILATTHPDMLSSSSSSSSIPIHPLSTVHCPLSFDLIAVHRCSGYTTRTSYLLYVRHVPHRLLLPTLADNRRLGPKFLLTPISSPARQDMCASKTASCSTTPTAAAIMLPLCCSSKSDLT